MMKGLKPTDGFFIGGWMRTDLDLKGAELMAYALVHQFSQSSSGIYKGGVNYLSSWLGCSYRSAYTYLKSLVKKGYINEFTGKENGVPYCYYTANIAGDMQNFPIGTANIADRIIIKNINNTLSNKDTKRFHKPTLEEIEQYCSERNNGIKAESFYNFYEAKGWKVGKNPMVDWKAAIRTWEQRERSEAKPRTTSKKESVYAHNLRVMQEINGMFHPNTNTDEQ